MNVALSAFMALLGLVVLGWGFERYRTRFVRTDLLIATAFGFGLLAMAFVPAIYDIIGSIFNIQKRYVAVTMLGNTALLFVVLYLASELRDTRSKLSELTRNLSVEQAPRANGGNANIIQVVVPAYNEAETIGEVIRSLPEELLGYDVDPIVVSDASADKTARKAEINGTIVVKHAVNQGQGGALQTGFKVAQRNNADIVVTMDADGQHPADELENLVRPIVEDEADFVMGSRYHGDDHSGNGPVRRAGIWTFTKIINVLTKSNITDCTNGFRAIRGGKLEELRLTEERFNAPELIIEARKNGLRVEEMPITIDARQSGETKKPQLGYAFGLTRTILTSWLR